MPSEFLELAERALRVAQRPMTAKEIVDYAIAQGWFSDRRAGRTPAQTMKSKLSVAIRRDGEHSTFVRTAPGRFQLRNQVTSQIVYEARPYRPSAAKELVLTFPAQSAPPLFQGVVKDWSGVLAKLEAPDVCRVLARDQAEQTDDHKQLLTYVLVTRRGSVLAFKRGVYNRVEDMLRGAHCVGFGGHVRPDDRELLSPDMLGIYGCARRELTEELQLPERDRVRLLGGEGLRIVGLLNDDSSDVGRRHLAVVLEFQASDDSAWETPRRGEKSITQLRWLSPSSPVRCWEFEYWSQLCLRTYLPRLVETAAGYVVRRAQPFQPPHILCLVGEVGSGKTEAGQVLVSEFGYTPINSGQVLAGLMGLPPIPVTGRDAFQRAAHDFISQEDGPERLAAAMLQRVGGVRYERLLIDGIRHVSTLSALRALVPDATRIAVLFVHTTVDVAYRLYLHREAKIPFDRFLTLRDAEVEAELSPLINRADGVLYNWTGRRGYRRTVRGLMHELGITRRVANA